MHELLTFNSESSCRHIRSKGDSLSSISECPQTADSVTIAKLSVVIKSLQQKLKKIETHNAMIVKENIEYVQSIEERERQNNLKMKKIELKMEQMKEKLNRLKKKNRFYKQRLEQIGKRICFNGLGLKLVKTNQKINIISDELENNQKEYHNQTKRIESKLKKLSRTMKSFHARPKCHFFRKKHDKSNLASSSRKILNKSMQVYQNK